MIFLMKRKSMVTLCTTVFMFGINFLMSGYLAYEIEKDFQYELEYIPATHIRASFEKARDSYVDSEAWDVESVFRLTSLLSQRKKADTVVKHLDHNVPGRRFMNYADSLKAFPSLSDSNGNNFYYDTVPNQDNDQEPQLNSGTNGDNSVIIITNPSEARLPSDLISVKLLRETMEARAKAARSTPSTTKV